MKVLVTGGAGFIGSEIVKQLHRRGHEPVVYDNLSTGCKKNLDAVSDVRLIVGDIRDRGGLDLAMAGCEIVFHLAANVGNLRSLQNPVEDSEVNVLGTLNVLGSARLNGVKKIIYSSSAAIFGEPRYLPMDEKHPLNPETPYAAAKVAQDMYVHSYGSTYGLPWTTIRPFNMYGPYSHWQGFRGELIPKMIVRAMNQKPLVIFGDGHQTRDFIYVEEAARAVISIAENLNCHNQCINFCSGIETSILQIAELICQHFNLDPNEFIQHQPPRPGDVKRHLGDNSNFKYFLNFSPEISIEEGIHRTIEWFQSLPYKPEELYSQEILRGWE